MDIVGPDQPDAEIAGQLDQHPVRGLLVGYVLVLDFDEESLWTENIEIFAGHAAGVGLPPRQQQLGHLAAQAGGGADQAFMELRQQFPVDARLVVEPLGIGSRAQEHQVAPTR